MKIEKQVVKKGTCGTNTEWTLDEEGTLVIRGDGEICDCEWDIYGEAGYCTLSPWHSGYWGGKTKNPIRRVIIEPGIKSIGRQAFCRHRELEEVSIPETVEKIGYSAFRDCSLLKKISIPGSVKTIGNRAFFCCRCLESVILEEGIEKIGENAFQGCKINEIVIPHSMKKLGVHVFDGKERIILHNPNTEVYGISVRNALFCEPGIAAEQVIDRKNPAWCRTVVPLHLRYGRKDKRTPLVYEGTILTCDKENHICRFLVEQKGRIVYVGDELPEQYQNSDRIVLGQRVICPPFADTHMHFASYATFHAGLNVMNADSNEKILKMLKEYTETCKDKMILAFGASPYSVYEKTLVTREQLDAVCPDKPLFLVKYDGHACVVNTVLLKKVKEKIQNLRGYHEETGEMNQEAFFAVSDYVTNSIPIMQLIRNMQKAVDDLAAKGIGMIHSVSGVGFPHDLDVDLERWFAAGLDNGMQMRVFMQTMDTKKAVKRKLPRIGGCFEAALDGCFGSKDAALLAPYENSDDKGVLYYSDEQVIEFCKKSNRAGLQIAIHAIGDAAFEQAARAIKAALDEYPRENHRHAIIHACLPTEEGISICEQYKIQLQVQSAFIDWPQEPDQYLQKILGERAEQLNPLRTFWDHNILLSAGSDAPCTEPDPIKWFAKAYVKADRKHRLSAEEALKMCTYNGYYSSFDEVDRGSLEIGKIADMVILSDNPLKDYLRDRLIPKHGESAVVVDALLLGGRPYKKISQKPVVHVLKGILKK